jgi:hypothetical protein
MMVVKRRHLGFGGISMKQESNSGNKGGGSKFLPGGGKNSNNKKVQNQTNRTMHTNQSHMGGSHGR